MVAQTLMMKATPAGVQKTRGTIPAVPLLKPLGAAQVLGPLHVLCHLPSSASRSNRSAF